MYQTDFSKEESQGRRTGVSQAIGPEVAALVRGSPKNQDCHVFRQYGDFRQSLRRRPWAC